MRKAYLRKAEWADVDLLFEWANDSEVRNSSFNAADIKHEEHKRWFENCMLDKDVDIYIFYLDADPVGQIRLNYKDKTAVINYNIAKKYRRQGFGGVIVKLIEAEVVSARPDITFLAVSVKLDNIASQRIFEDNGFNREFIDGENEHYNYCKKIDRKVAYTDKFIDVENSGRGGVLLITNNRNALVLYDWLLERGENVYLYSGKLNISQLEYMPPDIIVSYNYKYLIRQDVITFMQGCIINLHISYLPWNKGSDPNFWSFIDNTPKGVTIHKVDAGLDTGDIVCQRLVEFDEDKETLRTSYEKLNSEITAMFAENWNGIKNNTIRVKKQEGNDTYHTKRDFKTINELYPVNWDENITEYKRRIAQE